MHDRPRAVGIALALLGLGIASYLTYVHYAGVAPICSGSHGCEKVQTSEWSKLVGIPVAVLGLIGYAGILASFFVPGEPGLMAGAAFALVGLGFSAYLTYREIWSIEAICIWCVASAIVLALLTVVTVTRLLRSPPQGGQREVLPYIG